MTFDDMTTADLLFWFMIGLVTPPLAYLALRWARDKILASRDRARERARERRRAAWSAIKGR